MAFNIRRPYRTAHRDKLARLCTAPRPGKTTLGVVEVSRANLVSRTKLRASTLGGTHLTTNFPDEGKAAAGSLVQRMLYCYKLRSARALVRTWAKQIQIRSLEVTDTETDTETDTRGRSTHVSCHTPIDRNCMRFTPLGVYRKLVGCHTTARPRVVAPFSIFFWCRYRSLQHGSVYSWADTVCLATKHSVQSAVCILQF